MRAPLGAAEDLQTEFKRADALKDPANIAREIVGFLNASGGTLWIGIIESDGVASAIDPVIEPARQLNRLRDALTDLIEPSPSIGEEVHLRIENFAGDASQPLLRLDVGKGRHGPYALLKQGARAFFVRTGARLRAMTREELASAFARADARETTLSKLTEKLQGDLAEGVKGFAGLKLMLRPVEKLELALDAEKLRPLLQEPARTGNRRLGWNFTSPHGEAKPHKNFYRFGKKSEVQWLDLHDSGDIEFSAILERLHWRGAPKSLWPYALLELPASVLRLARALYLDFAKRQPRSEAQLVLGLGLSGIRGWTLGPGSPQSMDYMFGPDAHHQYEEAAFTSEPAIVDSWETLRDRPDFLAVRLIAQVYRAFGYEEKDLPIEYNRDAGQLVFPS